MSIEDALRNVTHLFGVLTAVTSPITLAECLVLPYRSGASALQQAFFDITVHVGNTIFIPIDDQCAQHAAAPNLHL